MSPWCCGPRRADGLGRVGGRTQAPCGAGVPVTRGVTPETRERVRWAMQKLNYVRNLLARSFRAGADAAIGLALPDIGDRFSAEMTSSPTAPAGPSEPARPTPRQSHSTRPPHGPQLPRRPAFRRDTPSYGQSLGVCAQKSCP